MECPQLVFASTSQGPFLLSELEMFLELGVSWPWWLLPLRFGIFSWLSCLVVHFFGFLMSNFKLPIVVVLILTPDWANALQVLDSRVPLVGVSYGAWLLLYTCSCLDQVVDGCIVGCGCLLGCS
ncbi:hypothetical protein U1Q18_035967 [Sarracenia purpurea var. burkii]